MSTRSALLQHRLGLAVARAQAALAGNRESAHRMLESSSKAVENLREMTAADPAKLLGLAVVMVTDDGDRLNVQTILHGPMPVVDASLNCLKDVLDEQAAAMSAADSKRRGEQVHRDVESMLEALLKSDDNDAELDAVMSLFLGALSRGRR